MNEQAGQPQEMQQMPPEMGGENQQQEQISPQDLELKLAHLNRSEMQVLDQAQGGASRVGTGVKEYSGVLEAILQNPSLFEQIIAHFGHQGGEQPVHAAHGGEMGELASEGQMGDTEIAYLPVGLMKMLDSQIGGPSINPETGLPQYFLSSLMSGLGSMMGKGNMLGNIGSALGAFGSMFGGRGNQESQYPTAEGYNNPFRGQPSNNWGGYQSEDPGPQQNWFRKAMSYNPFSSTRTGQSSSFNSPMYNRNPVPSSYGDEDPGMPMYQSSNYGGGQDPRQMSNSNSWNPFSSRRR